MKLKPFSKNLIAGPFSKNQMKTIKIKITKQIDWYANPNIRPVCLPSAGAGDFDQWMSTATGTSVMVVISAVFMVVVLKVAICVARCWSLLQRLFWGVRNALFSAKNVVFRRTFTGLNNAVVYQN